MFRFKEKLIDDVLFKQVSWVTVNSVAVSLQT